MVAALPAVLQDLSVRTGEFINATRELDATDLPRIWPILAAMVLLLLCLCLCFVCLIRGNGSKRRRHRELRRADSWASSGDESDVALDPNGYKEDHDVDYDARASELMAHEISDQDAPAAPAARGQHPHVTPRANDRGMDMQTVSPSPQVPMEGLNTVQRGRLEALRPKGLRQLTTDTGASYMLDSVTPPRQQLPDSPSFADALLGSEAAGWHDVPQGMGAPSTMAHSAIPSQLHGFPWQDRLPVDDHPPRILDSSWTPLDVMPLQVQERDPYTWCDVRMEENAPANVGWSDVRIDE